MVAALSLLLLSACRSDDEGITRHEEEPAGAAKDGSFYLLNEGNMGSNKCTLDYYDAASGTYLRNIYAEANPGVVQELGDQGNDLAVYGGRLWAVVCGSGLVEVMDEETTRHLGQISIPGCRYIAFSGDYAYVSTYACEASAGAEAGRGYVAKIDCRTLQVVATCTVGYQPEELAVSGGRLYVANSGGYRYPNYDRTVSVIDLGTFTTVKEIDVAINLHRVEVDSRGDVWVSSRGDYYTVPSRLYVIDPAADAVRDSVDVACSEMTLAGDSLYVYSTEWNYTTGEMTATYAIIDAASRRVVTRQFITDGTEREIVTPYGLAVDPATHRVYMTDAGDYKSPGTLYCFTPGGEKVWSVRTGDIPSRIAFRTRPSRGH